MPAYRGDKWLHPETREVLGFRNPRDVYVIRKKIGGRRGTVYEKSTGQTDIIRALVEFERFLEDPPNYESPDQERTASVSKALGVPVEPPKPKLAPIYLTPELIEEHLAWAEREGKIKSRRWATHKRAHLHWWMRKLHGVNLRALPQGAAVHPSPSPIGCDLGEHVIKPLDALHPKTKKPLVPKGTRTKHIAAIKSLYAWLRTEKHSLKVHEDPLFGTLKNIKTKKQQEFGKVTKLNSIEDTLKVMAYWEALPMKRNGADVGVVGGHAWKASVLGMHLATPWHFEEILRFANPAEPKSRIIVPGDPLWREVWREVDPETAAVVTVQGKREQTTRFKITEQGLFHARRLREHGKIGDPEHFRRELNEACRVLGIPRIYLGRFRHTHLTLATDQGVDEEVVQESAHHKSKAMTEIYTETAVPKRVPTAI
ncbi:MAG: hypothetical protein AUH82_01145 [Chloroflexi bacterium 13_1_40CM_4_65_13]|nr:MAG: hypothetical protein AUH82_01145 [Chloroflexi bacterium 13_1_40CM_4_65_13]